MSSLSISRIRINGGTQTRESIRPEVVAEYAEANGEMPPVVVFYDGKDHWLADGFHRLEARKKQGKGEIECDIRQGTLREAILFSVSANARHGLRRSSDDKRRGVLCLLSDEEWGKCSDRWIAETCFVSSHLVATVRKENFPENEKKTDPETSEGSDSTAQTRSSDNGKERKRKGKDGKERPASKPKVLCERCQRVGAVKDCEACKAARKKKKLTEDVDEENAKEEDDKPDPTTEEVISERNGRLESFCRKIMAVVDEMPEDEWLDYMNRKGSALQKFKDGCAAVRSAKCHCACPMCKGAGCAKCEKTGRVPKYVYDQMVS